MTEETLNQVTRDQAVKELITPNGAQLGIYHVKNTSLYKLAFTKGGELPDDLKNHMFTDTGRAYDHGYRYIKARWDEEKGKKDDEEYHSPATVKTAQNKEDDEMKPKRGRPRKDAS